MSGAGRPPLAMRVAAVFVGATAIWILLSVGVAALLGDEYTRTAHVVRAIGATLLTVPLIVAARRLLDRAPLSGLRLTGLRDGWPSLLTGILCWAVPAAVAGAAVVALGWAQLGCRGPRRSSPCVGGGDQPGALRDDAGGHGGARASPDGRPGRSLPRPGPVSGGWLLRRPRHQRYPASDDGRQRRGVVVTCTWS
ncbi:hypothetical protein [Mycolicibacterium sp.]|uniref:hypothetical protein n=1 Tax=Mycolicibacterium sp. TaxID=2320850 RepID=UPI003D0F3265